MAKKLPSINIHGKEYVTVIERVRHFNEVHPAGMIETSIEEKDERIIVKAKVTPDIEKPARYFVGHAEEKRGSVGIAGQKPIEVCETSAVGRALAMMGIGLIESIASAEEVLGNRPVKTFALSDEKSEPKKCVMCGKMFRNAKNPAATNCYTCWKKVEQTRASFKTVSTDPNVAPF